MHTSECGGEKLQRACGLNIWFEWDPTKACSTGDAGSFIVRRVVRALAEKAKSGMGEVAKVRGGSGGLALVKRRALVGQERVGTGQTWEYRNEDGDREGWQRLGGTQLEQS